VAHRQALPIVVDEYDIDPTEVTRGAYQAFLDAAVDPGSQPVYCAWNDDFVPRTDGDCEGKVFDPVTYPKVPVTCVDVCDARAYCTWKGRQLCGKIGGGKLLSDFAGDVTQSQWFRACSAAGAKAYPYGDEFGPDSCKTAGAPGGAQPIEVETFATCEGGYAGLFDMSGNVAEWEDACADGADGMVGNVDDSCLVRGGAFWAEDSDARCDAMMYRPPGNAVSNDWGFRCCGG
jgi:formylglycine-generating enzyme required for sulfatase activity